MLDFAPSAALEWIDLSDNKIQKIENVGRNPILRQLYLDKTKYLLLKISKTTST